MDLSDLTVSNFMEKSVVLQRVIFQHVHLTTWMGVTVVARPRGYKTFHAKLSWAQNLSCS